MKTCILQPRFSRESRDMDACFRELCALLDECDDSMDLIVLPERCTALASPENEAQFREALSVYGPQLEALSVKTAKRCRAIVCVNYDAPHGDQFRNTTFVYDREGKLVKRYEKSHPAPAECKNLCLDTSYADGYQPPCVLELEGLRFCFLTCYDFYEYELLPQLARQKPDILIGCCLQRTDSPDSLELYSRFASSSTNAWLVRASASMGADSPTGGCGMIVSPEGTIMLNMKNRVGLGILDIDPTQKYYRRAGFGGAPTTQWEYAEKGRRPWLYRPSGSMTVPGDAQIPYPRICAHRGFSAAAPENTLPAFGTAVALDAQELEFDLWWTKDSEIVSIHDSTLDRVSTGCGNVWDYTLDELRQLDFGVRYAERFRGLRIVTLEQILQKFARHAVFNIHLKSREDEPYDVERLRKITALIDQYDCRSHVYFMSGSDDVLEKLQKYFPDFTRCCGAGPTPESRWGIVERAIRFGCQKVQLFKEYYSQEMIDKAHAHGILCNYFHVEEPEQARKMLAMGIDTLLSNDCLGISNALKDMAL